MPTPVKDKPADQHDLYVERQLDRTGRRVRFIDLAAALFGLAAAGLAFAAATMLLDRALHLSSFTRFVSLLLFLGAAGVFVAYGVVRPLRWRVNPRYAARLLEDTIDSDRNHVVNWVDLRGVKLPGVIKSSLRERAAKDLAQTDPDRAVSARRAYVAGGAFGLAFVVFLSLIFVFGLSLFGSLFARAVVPFGRDGAVTRTHVSIVRPEGGDAVVTMGKEVTIVAKVTGRVPAARAKDAPCLLYRRDESEPYRQRYMQPVEGSSEWAATVAPGDVGEGFFYKVTAGDAETPEHRVTTRPRPLIQFFRVTYHHRPYVNRAARLESSRKLEALEGTEAEITIWATRDVASGRLLFAQEFDEKGDVSVHADAPQPGEVRGEPVPDEPRALRFRAPLWKTCKYRIEFATPEAVTDAEERYADARPEDVIVIPDDPPKVKITAPAKNVSLPADGHLEIEGVASDDVGVARVELLLSVDDGPWKPVPYLADKLGKPGYGTPTVVAYKHLLELPALLDSDGKKVELKPGSVIKYRLRAADACDFREQQTVSDPAYQITIVESKKDEEARRQKERDKARQQQQEHEKNEADRVAQEKKSQDQKREKEEEETKAEKAQDEKDRKGGGKEEGKGKEQDKGENKTPEKPDDKQKPDEKKKQEDQKTEAVASKVKEELDRKDDANKGEGKDSGDKDDKNNKGEGKDGDGKDGKEGGKAGDKDGKAGEGKDGDGKEGKDGQDGKGEGKQPSSAKPPPNKDGKHGESKDAGKGQSDGKEKGERKPESDPKPGEAQREGKGKKSDTQGKPTGGKPGQNPQKDDRPSESKPQDRQAEKASEGKKGEGKGKDDSAGKGKSSAPPKDQTSEGKPGSEPRPDPREAKAEDVKKAAEDLKHADAKKRQRAANDLKQIGEKAKDAEAQKAAKTAIDEAKKAGDLDMTGNVPGQLQGSGNEKEEDGAEGKGKPADQGEKKDERRQGRSGNAKGRQQLAEGDDPGEGSEGPRKSSANGGGPESEAEKRNQAARKARASQLQLVRFKDKVDRDVLQKLNMSREQFERFLRDYEALAKRQQQEADRLEKTAKSAGNSHTSGGPLEKVGKAKDNVRNKGRSEPPPGYREEYNKLEKLLRRLKED
jgi:flagellar biosynthesis GTPase FlhF